MTHARLAMPAACARARRGAARIQGVFSSADGTVQFVQLRDSDGQNGLQALAGRTLTVTLDGRVGTFTFLTDLPGSNTASRGVLVTTQGSLLPPLGASYPPSGAC